MAGLVVKDFMCNVFITTLLRTFEARSSQNCKKWILASSLVCPSVRPPAWRKSAPNWWIFMKFDIWVFFRKSFEKIQVLLQSDKNKGHFTWRPMYIYDYISLDSFQREKRLDKSCKENLNTHFVFHNFFFFTKSCCLWDDDDDNDDNNNNNKKKKKKKKKKKRKQPERPQMTM